MQRGEYKTVDVWGLNVHYVDTGENGDGPVVLLLHGLADSLLSCYCNIDALAADRVRAITPDLPGSGESEKPGHLEYDPGSAAEFVYDLTQELTLKRFSFVGSSASGLISGLFALEHPEVVKKMALVSSGRFGRRVSWFLRAVSIPVLGKQVYQPWLSSQMGLIKRLFHRPPPVPDELLPERNPMQLLPGARPSLLRSIRSSISLMGVWKEGYILKRLKGSEVPLTTICKNKRIIPVRHADYVRRKLPNSALRVVPECGRWPQMEKPDQFNPMLISFLQGGPIQTAKHES